MSTGTNNDIVNAQNIKPHKKSRVLPAATPCSIKPKAVSKWSLSFSSALSSTEMQLYLVRRGLRGIAELI